MPANYPQCCKDCQLKSETTCELCHKLDKELDAIERKLTQATANEYLSARKSSGNYKLGK